MYPIICKIGPFVIYSYGLMLALGFVVSLTLIREQSKKNKTDFDLIFNLCFVIFIFGIIGARVFYIGQNLFYYIESPLEMIMLQHGGMSWFGGLMAGTWAGIIFIKKKKLSVYQTLDFIVPYVALAQAIGRIGCLLNGCCYGKPSEYGFYFPVHDARLIPTQIYSSLIMVLIFLILRFLQDRPHKAGQILFLYLLFYSTKRFFIEFWRDDNMVIFSGMTLFQLLSVAIFLLSVIKLVSGYRKI